MPDLKSTRGVPVIVQRKTAYYVNDADGASVLDPGGHSWFGKSVALAIARETGGMYFEGSHSTIKQVVTGYLPEQAPGALDSAVNDYLLGLPGPFESPQDLNAAVENLGTQLPLGCTCGGIGSSGSHASDCVWGAR